MPKAMKIYESVLYAGDLREAEKFYSEALGLEVARRSDLLLTFRCGESVLLVFDPEKSAQSDRSVPSHGAKGPGHIAFAVEMADLDAWRARLAAAGVEIEQEVEWESGGCSIYVRDPAGNSVELAPPTLWDR